MKKLLLIALVSMISVASFARKGVTTVVVSQDTVFYNQQMEAVNNSEHAEYYRLFAKESFKGQQRDIFQDFYMNGKLRAEGGYSFLDLGNDKNTVLDGDVTTYYPNGSEKWRCTYKNGKRNGYFVLQLRDGGIAVIEYKNGEPRTNYLSITRPDGTMEKASFKNYKMLLQ